MSNQISSFQRSPESITACHKMVWSLTFAAVAVSFGLLAPTLMKAAAYSRLFSGDALIILICFPLAIICAVLMAVHLSKSVARDELQMTELGIRLRRFGITRSVGYGDIREVFAATNNLKPVTRLKLQDRTRFDIPEAFVSFDQIMQHLSAAIASFEAAGATEHDSELHVLPRRASRLAAVTIIVGTLIICGSAAIFAAWNFKSDPVIARTALMVIPIVVIGSISALVNRSRRFTIEQLDKS